jgi:hypothetical protein
LPEKGPELRVAFLASFAPLREMVLISLFGGRRPSLERLLLFAGQARFVLFR